MMWDPEKLGPSWPWCCLSPEPSPGPLKTGTRPFQTSLSISEDELPDFQVPTLACHQS